MTPQLQMEILTPSKSEASQDDELKAPSPPRKRHPSKEGGIVEFIPPLRGDSGGCAFFFFVSSLFTYFGIFRTEEH